MEANSSARPFGPLAISILAGLSAGVILGHGATEFHEEEALQPEMGSESTDLPAPLSFLVLDLVKGHLMTADLQSFPCLGESME